MPCAIAFDAINWVASWPPVCDVKRVLLISHGFQPDYEAGFSSGLARNGVEVELVSSDRTLVDRLAAGVNAINLRGSQDRSRSSWRKAANLFRYYLQLGGLLIRRRGTPIHLVGHFAVDHPLAWRGECLLYRALGRRFVLTVHNVVPHDRDTPAVREALRVAYRIPYRLVVHTRRARERLIEEFGVEADRIVVMDHGIDEIPPLDDQQVNAARLRIGVREGERLVVFFGAVLPYKGVDLFLEAAVHFGPDVRVVIAGRCGDAEYRTRIRKLVDSHPLGERVCWNDAYVPEEAVTELLAAADVIAMPYRHIDQSGVLFAALRHGVPVVAFDVGSLREYLLDGAGVVVPPGDIKAFASAVMHVEPSAVARPRIQRIAERFLWAHTVAPVLALCEV